MKNKFKTILLTAFTSILLVGCVPEWSRNQTTSEPYIEPYSQPANATSSQEKPKSYTVTWKNWDGTVLEIDYNVPEGAMPSYDGEDPTRKEDDNYVYVWKGEWSAPLSHIYSDMTYTAKFFKNEKVKITSDNYRSFITYSRNVSYVYEGSDIWKNCFFDCKYDFSFWSVDTAYRYRDFELEVVIEAGFKFKRYYSNGSDYYEYEVMSGSVSIKMSEDGSGSGSIYFNTGAYVNCSLTAFNVNVK